MNSQPKFPGAKHALICMAFIGLAACSVGDEPGFSANDAGIQAVILGGLAMSESPIVTEFPEHYGSEAGRVLQERYAHLQPAMEMDALAVYEEVYSKEEMKYIRRFYGTKQGREILRKQLFLYPKLSVIGQRYASKAMANPSTP